MIFPITKNLVSFQLRYYDDDEDAWFSNWGEEERVGLPALVKFSLALKSPKGKIDRYTTAIKLRNREQQ